MEGFSKRLRESHQVFECKICKQWGVQIRLANEIKVLAHKNSHTAGFVSVSCSQCNVSVVAKDTRAFLEHKMICSAPVADEDDDEGDDNERRVQRSRKGLCPSCRLPLASFGSAAKQGLHLGYCARRAAVDVSAARGGNGAAEGAVGSEEDQVVQEVVVNDVDVAMLDQQDDAEAVADVDQEHEGNGQDLILLQKKLPVIEFPFLPPCDAMLFSALRVADPGLSERVFHVLWDILNLSSFRSDYIAGGLSKSFDFVAKSFKKVQKDIWSKEFFGESLIHWADFEVICGQILNDPAILENLDFGDNDESCFEDENNIKWSSSFAHFPVYQIRKRLMKQKFEHFDFPVNLVSLALWLDSGHVDDKGNSIYLVCVYPLNVPHSISRRIDCIFAIGFTYSGSDVVDILRKLLPVLIDMRNNPRLFQGMYYVFELHEVVGDFPAITRLLMMMMSGKIALKEQV